MQVSIDRRLAAAMRQHARAAYPAEACGLLARCAAAGDGDQNWVRFVHYEPMENCASRADRFRMDPIAVARAERRMREAGLELAGVFHSHPHDAAVPSVADREAAWPGLFQLILGIGDELRAFERRGDELCPVAFGGQMAFGERLGLGERA